MLHPLLILTKFLLTQKTHTSSTKKNPINRGREWMHPPRPPLKHPAPASLPAYNQHKNANNQQQWTPPRRARATWRSWCGAAAAAAPLCPPAWRPGTSGRERPSSGWSSRPSTLPTTWCRSLSTTKKFPVGVPRLYDRCEAGVIRSPTPAVCCKVTLKQVNVYVFFM